MIYEDDLYEADPDTWSQPLWTLEISAKGGLREKTAQDIVARLEDSAVAVHTQNHDPVDGDSWSVRLTTLGPPDEKAAAAALAELGLKAGDYALAATPVEQKDWLRHVHDAFPPVTAGRFFVHGSHYEGAPPEGKIPLKIDAATAFGSGEHETTQGCLLALEELSAAHAFKNALDMGCGSGILAAGIVKLWPGIAVTAVDIDPECIRVTRRHAEMNGLSGIACQQGDGYAAPAVGESAPFGLVVANILADPLIAMAPALAGVLENGGFCVLSGILARQAESVIAAHEKEGLSLASRRDAGAWSTLVLQKPGG